jgi:hypothetical protein
LELVEKENREFEAMDEWNTREEREYAIAHGFDPFGSIAYDEWWRTHNATDIGPSERCGSQSYQEWAEALPVSSEPVPF